MKRPAVTRQIHVRVSPELKKAVKMFCVRDETRAALRFRAVLFRYEDSFSLGRAKRFDRLVYVVHGKDLCEPGVFL